MSESNFDRSVEDRRSVIRDQVDHRTKAMLADDTILSVLVVNISPDGLRARCDMDLSPGEPIRIVLPCCGPVAAQISWSLGGRFGCQFDEMLPQVVFDPVLAAMRGEAPRN